jgi:DNA polymerase-1
VYGVQVHDELLFEVPDSEVAATLPVVKRVMETAAAPTHALSVPLIVDAGSGPSWGDAH